MSRSGYSDDCDNLALWRGAVRSATRGKRGQAFFRGLVAALDALPEKRLIEGALQTHGGVCALGALGRARRVDMDEVDRIMRQDDYDGLGQAFDIAPGLAQETMYVNDEQGRYNETPEERWTRVRKWAAAQLRPEPKPEPEPEPETPPQGGTR
jgi:hypothetical protein